MARDFIKEIEEIMNALNAKREQKDCTSKKVRLLAIAITHLETAKLFLKEMD